MLEVFYNGFEIYPSYKHLILIINESYFHYDGGVFDDKTI